MPGWEQVDLQSYPCDLCGSNDYRTVMEKAGKLIKRPFTIVQCRRCSHVWVSPRVPDALIPALYDAEYFAGRGFDTTVSYELESQTGYRSKPIVTQIIDTVRQAFPQNPHPRVLDIGCGLGDLVLGMRDRDIESYGTDLSEFAQKVLSERKVPTLDDFSDAPERYRDSFDLVTCIEVIEHTTSPKEFIAFTSQFVKPGGYIFVLTGNWFVQRLVPGTPYIMPEGHIHYFTPRTLARLFRSAGLIPVQVSHNFAWPVNRSLPASTPQWLRRALQSVVQNLTPELGPLPIARRPVPDADPAADTSLRQPPRHAHQTIAPI
jgi:SAM-dependent methyltransferase